MSSSMQWAMLVRRATIYLSHLEQMQYVCMIIKDIQVHLSDLMIKGGSPKVIVNTITRHIAVPVPVTTHYGHHWYRDHIEGGNGDI